MEQELLTRVGPPLNILPGCYRRTVFRCRRWDDGGGSCNHVDFCIEQLNLSASKDFIAEKSKSGQKAVYYVLLCVVYGFEVLPEELIVSACP
ncbi:hypothetical protein PF001_g30332 [Phytophthora fragariae]|uniref:Uncharacterized protein n=1 Tax=Phytophthora fragariae TaxID=53985 RepID=A0A6A4B030_9STRA|nr:hypothetical protein PF001_g30332 [Phytophthora fragariae]